MLFATVFSTITSLCLLLPVSAAYYYGGNYMARRQHVGQSEHWDLDLVQHLEKRFDARFTYYSAGLGACGMVNSDQEFIVALNHIQFDSGDFCSKVITVTYNGKSAQAKIMDRCAGCPYGALDLSPSLFRYFAPESKGVIFGSWVMGGAPPPPKQTAAATPSQTSSSSSTMSSSGAAPSSAPTTPPGNLLQINAVLLNLAEVVLSAPDSVW